MEYQGSSQAEIDRLVRECERELEAARLRRALRERKDEWAKIALAAKAAR